MEYDVVVVGAGPSGSTAAKILAHNGVHVLLVDKEKFPREKTCGGGLPIRTLSRFPYLKNSQAIESYSYGGFVYAPTSTNHTKILKTSPVLATVLRSKFDQGLVNLSVREGAEFQDGMKVSDVTIHKDHAELVFTDGTSIQARILIGADGAQSLIAKKTGLNNYASKNKGICVLVEFYLSNALINQYYTSNRLCHIHSKFNGIKGYGWVFPKRNHVNVGIVSYDYYLTKQKVNVNSVFGEYCTYLKENSILPSTEDTNHIRGGVLPVQPLPKTFSERVLLCGDAAGLINPISGEGIHYALVSGELAGKVASDAIEKQDVSEQFLSRYEKLWKKEFGKDIRLFLRSKKRWGKQGDKMINLMNKDPEFAEMIFLIMVGKESAYDLRWKLVKRYLRNLVCCHHNLRN